MSNISSTIQFIYFKDYANSCKFFHELMGLEVVLEFEWCTVWKVSDTSFIGGVDVTKREKHYWAEQKCGLISFNVPTVDDLRQWHDKLTAAGYHPSDLVIGDQGAVGGLSGFWVIGPEGWPLEFEQFGDDDLRKVFHPEFNMQ